MKHKTMKPLAKNAPSELPRSRSLLRALGPAVIVASIVIGPGSILTSSKVGVQYGYRMVWVLLAAGFLMFALTSLAARLGAVYEGSFCSAVRERLGAGLAALTGLTVFLIAACFQFANNVGVLAAFESMFNTVDGQAQPLPTWAAVLLLTALNAAVLLALFGLKRIYRHLEKIMMAMVLTMVVVFAVNLLFAGPSLVGFLKGLLPTWPAGDAGRVWPVAREGQVISPAVVLVGLAATTCSFAAAFYQGYLVKEKGWTLANVKQQRIDAAAGIIVLVGISLIIMLTSAAVLHGTSDPEGLRSLGDVAAQLKPLLGQWGNLAVVLFSLGIFAGAFSSFLGNAMVGGVLLSDGLGFDCRLSSMPTKVCTALGLLVGMAVAVGIRGFGFETVPLIILGQGLTVLGSPLLAFTLLYLATRSDLSIGQRPPKWMLVSGAVAFLLALFLAARTAWNIWLSLSLG